jgi:GNAT superfamily N-acetyltransferase
VTAIERLSAANHAAVGRLLRGADADHAGRIGAGRPRRRDGRGLSRRLAEWCIERARARKAAGTDDGARLYERTGFRVDGDLPMEFGPRSRRFRLDL